jgi:DNA-directed RNA polymerase subunit alpha
VEDVSDIVLNLKSIPLKLIGTEQKTVTLKVDGPAEVKASNIIHDSDIEILDEDIHIATLDKDGKLDMEMIVKNNRGYIPAELNYDENLSVDFIPIDSSHSPVKQVNYEVSPARVGKRIDFEKLTLEIETTCAISPKAAIGQAAKILRDHLVIFLNIVDEPIEQEPETSKEEIPYISKKDILSKSIDHLELSVRSNNCLRAAGIEKIYELVGKTEEELLKTKNFGRKSLVEIKEILEKLELGLNIKLHPRLLEMFQGTDSEDDEEE